MNTSRTILAALSMILIVGCAATFEIYAPKEIDRRFLVQSQEGLSVAIQVFSDPAMIEQYLGGDLASQKILPVFVSIRNENASSSYVILKENVRIAVNNENASNTVAGSHATIDTSPNTAVTVAGVALVSPLLLVLGGKLLADKLAAQHNLIRQELRSETLGPGGQMKGFLYYPLTEKPVPGRKYSMFVEALIPQTTRKMSFVFAVAF